jgi:hypothetical protein
VKVKLAMIAETPEAQPFCNEVFEHLNDDDEIITIMTSAFREQPKLFETTIQMVQTLVGIAYGLTIPPEQTATEVGDVIRAFLRSPRQLVPDSYVTEVADTLAQDPEFVVIRDDGGAEGRAMSVRIIAESIQEHYRSGKTAAESAAEIIRAAKIGNAEAKAEREQLERLLLNNMRVTRFH